MKAEHRKELQTNLLADRLGKFLHGLKTKPSQASLVVAAVIVLVVIGIVAWVSISRNSARTRSQLWGDIDEATSVADLDKVIEDHPGTPPARTARFFKARKLMEEAQAHLYAPDFPSSIVPKAQLPMGRTKALESIKEAGDLYQKLADECKDSPVLAQEAYMGLGTARVILGDYDKAVDAYRECAKRSPKSPLGEKATKLAQQLEDDRANIREFQDRLATLAPKPFPG